MEYTMKFEAPSLIRDKKIISRDVLPMEFFESLFSEFHHQEDVYLLLLNAGCKPIDTVHIGRGSATASVVNLQKGCRAALLACAQSAILIHNHPSGQHRPSRADIAITNKMAEALAFFDIKLHDSLIYTKDQVTSLRETGDYNG